MRNDGGNGHKDVLAKSEALCGLKRRKILHQVLSRCLV